AARPRRPRADHRLDGEGHLLLLAAAPHPLDAAALPPRSADVARLDQAPAAVAREHPGHGARDPLEQRLTMSHDEHHEAAPAAGPGVLGVWEKTPRVRTVRLDREPMGVEATFLPAIVKGLGVTARHFFRNVFGRKYTATVEYPDQKPPYPERYRGVHRLMKRE